MNARMKLVDANKTLSGKTHPSIFGFKKWSGSPGIGELNGSGFNSTADRIWLNQFTITGNSLLELAKKMENGGASEYQAYCPETSILVKVPAEIKIKARNLTEKTVAFATPKSFTYNETNRQYELAVKRISVQEVAINGEDVVGKAGKYGIAKPVSRLRLSLSWKVQHSYNNIEDGIYPLTYVYGKYSDGNGFHYFSSAKPEEELNVAPMNPLHDPFYLKDGSEVPDPSKRKFLMGAWILAAGTALYVVEENTGILGGFLSPFGSIFKGREAKVAKIADDGLAGRMANCYIEIGNMELANGSVQDAHDNYVLALEACGKYMPAEMTTELKKDITGAVKAGQTERMDAENDDNRKKRLENEFSKAIEEIEKWQPDMKKRSGGIPKDVERLLRAGRTDALPLFDKLIENVPAQTQDEFILDIRYKCGITKTNINGRQNAWVNIGEVNAASVMYNVMASLRLENIQNLLHASAVIARANAVLGIYQQGSMNCDPLVNVKRALWDISENLNAIPGQPAEGFPETILTVAVMAYADAAEHAIKGNGRQDRNGSALRDAVKLYAEALRIAEDGLPVPEKISVPVPDSAAIYPQANPQ